MGRSDKVVYPCGSDPPENCHLTIKKLPKSSFLIFGNFFGKNVKFLAILRHSNGNFPEGQLETRHARVFVVALLLSLLQ